jgi:hypothetical protein
MDNDKFVLAGTINFDNRDEAFAIGEPKSLAELQDAIGAVIESKPQATSFIFVAVRKSNG